MRWFHQGWNIEVEIGRGSPAAGIIEKANQLKTDLIVIGSHGREAPAGTFFGNVAQKVLKEAPCSVRIARGRYVEPTTPVRLIIGADGSKDANELAKVVSSRNWPKGTEIRLVSGMVKTLPVAAGRMRGQVGASIAKQNGATGEAIDSALKTLRSAGLKASFINKDEEPRQLLCNEAESWRADCIFVGSRRTGSPEHSIVSTEVAANANCSVEVVRILG
jgi:nucleotide-binding universal stress UspA family protein